ncbi:hypothetical protein LUZ60_004472 [Juncus effusus]|nr:hypothetical protein LUZ60_004472 [Juncus effusus]
MNFGENRSRSYSGVMLPWLAHGHVLPFLELAKRLCDQDGYDIEVHICSTPINLLPIRNHLSKINNDLDDKIRRIKLVELHLPPFPGLSPSLHTTKFLPPNLMPSLKHAFDLSEPAFSSILDDLCPDFVIYDFLMPWAPLAAQSRGIPAFVFMTSSAASTAFFCHYSCTKDDEFPFPAIRLGEGNESRAYADMLDKSANGQTNRDRLLRCFSLSTELIAIKTFDNIESKYIKYLSFLTGKEIVPVGPLIPNGHDPSVDAEESESVMRWLAKKERSSVVFVSFGSEYFMSEQEIEQMAHGLELSGANFLWVVRFAEKEDQEKAKGLPCGFKERIGPERGLIVNGWAPQHSILKHPSVGAFLTHCGWSSVMEGMQAGVPMIALPLHLDQPLNAKLIVEVGVAMEISQQGFGKFEGNEIARVISLILRSEHGERIRKKAEEVAQMMQEKSDHVEIQTVVGKMVALCKKEEKCLIAN